MRNKRDKHLIKLVEEVQNKIKLIRSGSAFTADFVCAGLMESLVQELKLLSFENKNYKKKITYNSLFLTKKEHEIKILTLEKQDLVEKLLSKEK